jgi:hypothetical protein
MVSTPEGIKSFLLLFFKKEALAFFSLRVAAKKAWMPAFAGMTG